MGKEGAGEMKQESVNDMEYRRRKKKTERYPEMPYRSGPQAADLSIRWRSCPPRSMISPRRRSCCGRMTRLSMGTAHIWDWKSERKSNRTLNRRPGRLPKVSGNSVDWERTIENRRSSVRCKVEHPYRCLLFDLASGYMIYITLPNCEEHVRFPKDSLPSITCTLCQRGRFPASRLGFLLWVFDGCFHQWVLNPP